MPDRDLIPTPEEFERAKPKKKNFIARLVGRLRVKPGVGEEAQRVSPPPSVDVGQQLRDEERRLAEEREQEERQREEGARRLAEEQKAFKARKAAEQRRRAEERKAEAQRKEDEARKAAEAKRRADAKRAAALAAEADRKAMAAPPATPSRPARRITFREGVVRPTETHRGSVQGQTPLKRREPKPAPRDD